MNSITRSLAVLRDRWASVNESGQGLVEYSLLLMLISIATVTALTGLNGAISTQLSALASSL